MRRASVIGLAISLLACGGCSRRDTSFIGHFYVTRDAQRMVIERSPGTVVALSTRDGHELWRYQPDFPTLDYLDLGTRYSMVCPFVETVNGYLVLRYDQELHVISLRDGKKHWKARSYLFASGRCRCVATTPDSGLILIRRDGLAVQKIDSEGNQLWWYQLVGLGAAVNPPRVISPSGDTLIKTDSHIVSISPSGALNWAVAQQADGAGRRTEKSKAPPH